MMKSIHLILISIVAAVSASGATTQRDFSVSSGEQLEVGLQTGGSIVIEGWNRDSVSVQATGAGVRQSDVEIVRTSSGVSVQVERAHGGPGGLRIVARVPHRFDLSLRTMGGSIHVEGVRGTLQGITHGGELRLSRLGGAVDFKTQGGNVRLSDSQVEGKVKTMGGLLVFENVSGDVSGSTMGGDVTYRNVTRRAGRDGGPVKVSTMGGSIEVEDALEGIELSTMGGNVVVRKARQMVKAKTMGGDITLHGIDGSIEAMTMGGNVSATMVGDPNRGDRDVTITSKGGDIELVVPPGLDMDLDLEILYTSSSPRTYDIQSDVPLHVSTTQWSYEDGNRSRTIRGHGKIGSGKNKIRIRTINGNISLRQK
ncbi:MAG: DUF4097 domain-containing protein [Acidobacteria bacterium]|nr:DUF4097 domain-containing protein [Acidobacteriota bacterium]